MVDPKITLHVLIDLHRALARETALDPQLELVVRAAKSLLEADHASIRVLDDTGTELVSGARVGAGTQSQPVTFGRGLGIVGWVVDHGEPARIDDVSRDPRYVPVSGQGFEIRSMLAVPLLISGHVIGCLSAASHRLAAFTAFHEDLAILLATVAASPIERSRLEAIALRDPSTRAFGTRYSDLGSQERCTEPARRGTRWRSSRWISTSFPTCASRWAARPPTHCCASPSIASSPWCGRGTS